MGTKKYVYDKDCNYVQEFLNGTEEEIKQQLGKDIYISDVFLFNPVIDETGIRELTTTELVNAGIIILTDGQYLKNNEIVTIEKTDNYQYWDSKKKKWIYDKVLEINSLYENTAEYEQGVQNLEKELKEAQENNRRALVRELTGKIDALKEKITENYKRLDELEE